MQFELNLCLVLGHSSVFFKKEEYHGVHALCVGDDPPAPATNESTNEMLEAFTRNLPALMQAVSGEILPAEQAALEASQAVSPAYAALQAQLYETFGPQLNAIGSDIARQNALAQASTDAEVLAGPGRDVILAGLEASRLADPEYYALREQAAGGLGELMTGTLTGGERSEIERSLAQQNSRTGTLDVPSATETAANATVYGNASRDRLSQALSLATGALPAFKSGVDPFMQATGRASLANTGEAKFTGTTQTGDRSDAIANNLLGTVGELQQQKIQGNMQRQSNLQNTFESMPDY